MQYTKSPDIGIEEHFRRNAAAHPHADAVVEGNRTVSYKELDRLAAQLALQLSKYDLCIEEPIGILLPKGIANVVAQIAIIRVGGSCVPLDLAFPDQRIHKLFDNLKVRIVITNLTDRHRAPSCTDVIVVDESNLAENANNDMALEDVNIAHTGSTHRTHVLHTSGTTGEPKGVEIMSQGIMHLANNTVVVQVKPGHRIAQAAAPSFDVTLQEIWATLVVGATIVIMSTETLMDPYALHEALRHHQVRGIIMAPTLLQHVVCAVPHIFAGLDWVMTGGEPANPKVYKAMFDAGPPRMIVNGYGPTECSCITSLHSTTFEDTLKSSIPLGKPIDGVNLCILDDHQRPVQAGEIGELYIGGGTLSRGYHNRPEATAKRFCNVLSISGQMESLFRTGDLARYTPTGDIDFIGRNDDLLKINSKRIDLTEIKTVIMRSELAIDTIILPVSRKHKDMYVVAFTIPHGSNTSTVRQLDAYIRQFLPNFMIPRIELVQSLPLTPHGKTDRRLLINDHITACEKAEREHETVKSSSESPRAWLKSLWISLLGVPKVDDDSDFFRCGASSLQAAALAMHVRRRFNIKLTMHQIYTAPKFQQLLNFIEKAEGLNSNAGSFTDSSILDILVNDSKLVSNITVPEYKVSDWWAADCGRIFMTGATGHLGIHCLRDLISRPDVKEVRCLVRDSDSCTGYQRLVSLLTELGVSSSKHFHKVVAVPGSLGDENLGLDASEFADLAAWADTVFHVGAEVHYSKPYQLLRAANVLGTLDCIRLAVTARVKPLHFVSTACVTGPVAGGSAHKRIMEDIDLDAFQSTLPYDMGYTQSKWVAEKMVHTMQKRGLPAVVYRPGSIMGDGVRGKVNHADFMSRFIRGCLQLGYSPASPGQSQCAVTADFCSAAITHIASNATNHSHSFHIVPQSPEDDLDLNTMWTILDKMGYKCSAIPFEDWVKLMKIVKNAQHNALFSVLPILQQTLGDGRSLWEARQNMAVYDTTNCRAALVDMEYRHKSGIDREFLINYMREVTKKEPIMPAMNLA